MGIELVPVTNEYMDFICDEESNSELWCYEEYKYGDKWVDKFYFSILKREYHKVYKGN